MKLSDKESAILACAELQADAPISRLRKESGYREHTIRYALHRLQEQGIITPIPFINLHRIGFSIYNVFFSIDAQRKETKEALLGTLSAASEVLWIGEFGGEYQYGVAFAAQRFGSVVEFLRNLSRRYRKVFFEKAVSLQISTTVFPRRYLSQKRLKSNPITLTFDKSSVEIDELDKKVLSSLTTYSKLSHRQIALKVGVPLSTFDLRVKKLEEQGVIAAHIYFVDTRRLNLHSFKLLVFAKGIDPDLTAQLHRFCADHPRVTYMIECLGSWEYEIGIEVEDVTEVSSIVQALYESFGGIINTIKILTKFRYPKVRWFPAVT